MCFLLTQCKSLLNYYVAFGTMQIVLNFIMLLFQYKTRSYICHGSNCHYVTRCFIIIFLLKQWKSFFSIHHASNCQYITISSICHVSFYQNISRFSFWHIACWCFLCVSLFCDIYLFTLADSSRTSMTRFLQPKMTGDPLVLLYPLKADS